MKPALSRALFQAWTWVQQLCQLRKLMLVTGSASVGRLLQPSPGGDGRQSFGCDGTLVASEGVDTNLFKADSQRGRRSRESLTAPLRQKDRGGIGAPKAIRVLRL